MEIAEVVNEGSMETALRWVHAQRDRAVQTQDYRIAHAGMRAAHARDPKLLLVLEKGSEVLLRMSESQLGKTFTHAGRRMDATEHQMWRNAYTACDAGHADPTYDWIYATAACMAGLISR